MCSITIFVVVVVVIAVVAVFAFWCLLSICCVCVCGYYCALFTLQRCQFKQKLWSWKVDYPWFIVTSHCRVKSRTQTKCNIMKLPFKYQTHALATFNMCTYTCAHMKYIIYICECICVCWCIGVRVHMRPCACHFHYLIASFSRFTIVVFQSTCMLGYWYMSHTYTYILILDIFLHVSITAR